MARYCRSDWRAIACYIAEQAGHSGSRPTQLDVSEALLEAYKLIVAPIVDGLLTVVARFGPEFQRPMLGNIVLAGGGSQLRGLDRLIEESVRPLGGGKVVRTYDSVFAVAAGALKLAMGMPTQHWEKLRSSEPQPTTTFPTKRAAA